MKKKIFLRIAVLLLAAALALGGLHFRTAYLQQKEICDSAGLQLQQLTEQAALLEQELAGLTLDTAQAQTAQAAMLQRNTKKLAVEMEALKAEIDTLTLFLEENQGILDDAEEELTYLQGVYDELEKGLQKVEEYISAD